MANDHLFHGHALPNKKRSWNATNFTGAGKDYSSATLARRKKIERQHRDHALGLLYFLQNDQDVPQCVKEEALRWGLAEDEFKEFDHFPPILYIRESRRFKGEYVYREQDCLKASGLPRAPIHKDGIAFTEFALDSLPCTPERCKGSLPDGQFFEKDKSLPGSLPLRCLIPLGFQNLLVSTNPSVTHCAWGTVRQSACLLHLAEVAALAVDCSISSNRELASLSPFEFQIHLVRHGIMISFFNDLDTGDNESWKQAALLFGNRGFFSDYDARPDHSLKVETAKAWTKCVKSILADDALPPEKVARAVKRAEASTENGSISENELLQQLGLPVRKGIGKEKLTRKEGLEIIQNHIVQEMEKGRLLLLKE